ncbi:MAG: hypothetical protein M3Y68_15170 [Chloroflexota bacterium]|nr:hypothetical protein [Chloroflexota bacterium]
MRITRSVLTVVMLTSGLFLSSCLLPGMIPLNPTPEGPLPVMETDSQALLETIKSGKWVYLQALAEEEYTEEDYAGPGTLTYTVNITDDMPTYFSYGWCTTTEEILQQNFEHIRVQLSINGRELDQDVMHPVTFTRPDGFVCLSLGTLLSDWPPGEYTLEAAATFEEEINDGAADFEAGDYVFVYNVTVEE